MRKTWGALGAGVLALVVMASSIDPAQAYRRGGWHAGGAHFSGRAFAPRFVGRPYVGRSYAFRRHHHYRRGYFVGVPLAYGAYSYAYGYGNCRWLKYRALETGSAYWWRRYEACRYGYYW